MRQIHIIILVIVVVAIITAIQSWRKTKTESGYSPVEYSNYPNLTGNPIADIAILNQAGFKSDHS